MEGFAALAAEHEDDPEADERAEREMVQHGLTVSSAQVSNAPLLKARKPSLFVASSLDLLGRHGPFTPFSAPPAVGGLAFKKDFSFLKKRQFALGGHGSAADEDDSPCQTLRTALILPFCFSPDVERDPPAVIASLLLDRTVHGVPLWERCELTHDVSELSSQFKQLLGAYGPESSPVQRLRVTDAARNLLFSEARLWADTKSGDFAGKRCEWTDIQLVIFPHGAIWSVTFDWMPRGDHEESGGPSFTLSDLRNWIYVAKYRAIKVGVTRGWSFAQHRTMVGDEASLAQEKNELGIKLFAALYGGSCLSLGSIANWLVKMPHDSSSAIPRRISRFEYAQHYTYCMIEKPLSREKLEEHLFHIRRAQGLKAGLGEVSDASADSRDQVMHVRSNVAVGLAREGVVGIVWSSRSASSFQKRFFGIYLALGLHCLSERVTLEKLSYLEALSSQVLPSASDRTVGMAQKEAVRREIVALATSLVRYRTCMATDDCGGRPEYGEFFQILRSLYSIKALKKELGEEVHDMLKIVNRDWDEERRRSKKREMLWKIRRDAIAKEIQQTKHNTMLVSDVTSNAILGVCFPIMIAINLFSMNLPTMPAAFPWSWVLIIAGAFSAAMVGVFMVVYFYFRRQLMTVKAEKDELNATRAERLAVTTESVENAAGADDDTFLFPHRGYSIDEERRGRGTTRRHLDYVNASTRTSLDVLRESAPDKLKK